jgi:hypothetical protein
MTIKLHEVGSAAETFAVLENRSNDNVRQGSARCELEIKGHPYSTPQRSGER